jgi:predicted permease
MSWRRGLSKFGALFRRQKPVDDLEEEIRAHLQMEEQENLETGMSPEEAHYAALRRFGNVTRAQERSREMWGWNSVETLCRDLRYGARALAKNPGFTAVAVLTLALGIGANTAIFTLIDAVMLRSLPVANPQRLVLLRWSARNWPKTNSGYSWSGCPIRSSDLNKPEGCSFSYPMFEQMRSARDVFSAVFAFGPTSGLGVSIDGNASTAVGEFVSGDYFSALGIRAASGRLLSAGDEATAASLAVVLSYRYWQSHFGGSPSTVGKSIVVNGIPATVVGVAPPAFLGLDPGIVHDMWLPLSAQNVAARHWPEITDAGAWWVMLGARLKSGVTIAQAKAPAQVIFSRGVTSGGSPILKPEDAPSVDFVSVARGLVSLRHRFGTALFLLMAAVGLVLLIACANVASLILVRTAAREKELAVRFALGAARWRIARQLLTETLFISLGGGLLGVGLAYLGASALATFLTSNSYSALALDTRPDLRTLGLTITIAALAGVLVGVAPALRSTRINVAPALKEGAASPAWTALIGRRFGVGNVLVVAQVALSIVVLVGASLLTRTLIKLATVNIGFDAHNIVLLSVEPELNDYKGEPPASLFPDLQQRISALPGVASVGYSSLRLLSGSYEMRVLYLANGDEAGVNAIEVSPNFFETMHIPLLAGRSYNSHDFVSAAGKQAKVVVVNEAFARHYLGERSPIGQLILLEKGKSSGVQIIGVVGDAKYYSLRKEVEPTVYFPFTRAPAGTFEIRTDLSPRVLLASIQGAARSVDKNLPVSGLMTQTEQINRTIFQERLVAWLSAALALLALAVACIGLYGLLAHEVARRTHEVGVRMALGATSGEVLRLILTRGIRLVALGVVIGIGASLGLTRYLQSLLYGVRPIDPLAYGTVTMVLLIVTLGACYVPARRATKVDPMVALRYE